MAKKQKKAPNKRKNKSKRKRKSPLRIIPLGGLGEVGKNMMLFEYGKDGFIIDAGLMFPEEEMLGVDLVLPDFSYVKKNISKYKAIIITHGHEDHIGCLPFLLREITLPIYGTKLTLGLIEGKLEEYGLCHIDFREIKSDSVLKIGPFKIEFMRVCHSIPDGVGLAIHTPIGLVVHSGDFKLDQSPVDNIPTDYQKFASLGKMKPMLLMSDSTNSELPGYTFPERNVGKNLSVIFRKAKKRIIVASFASHIHRIQQVFDVAKENNRKVVISGRSMVTNVQIAVSLGYLNIPDKILLDIDEIKKYKSDRIVILCTGSQGEPLSALARMASHDHSKIELKPKDTVIISAAPIPGNEKSVNRIIDKLYQAGVDVYYESISGVHVSGHAAQEEIKLMLNIVSPKFYMPIHGEYRHLKHNAIIANSLGFNEKNIILAKNGDVIEFFPNKFRINRKVETGVIFVDGLGVGDIGDIVLRDRQLLSKDGIFIIVITINTQNGQLVSGPDIISRGFVYIRKSAELIDAAKERVVKVLEKTAKEEITDWSVLKADVKDTVSDFLYKKTKRRPMILTIIIEI